MKQSEVLQIMAVLKTAYPSFYAKVPMEQAAAAVSLWQTMFAEDDARLVAAAVKALIVSDVKGFPPHIGAVKDKLRQLTHPEQLSAAQAWALVSRAASRSAYRAREEFDKLPPALQQAVGSPNQLRDWALMDAGTFQSVVASNFQRAYRTQLQRQEELALLPPDVRAVAQTLGGTLALEAGELTQGGTAPASRTT